MINYSLKEIARIVNGEVRGDENRRIKGIQYDSRCCSGGELFAPIIGERVDGHQFVAGLFEMGVAASFWQRSSTVEIPEGDLIFVEDTFKAIRLLAKAYRQDLHCKVIAVTGSSGKTSTKDIIAATLSGKYRTYKTKGNQNNELGVPMMLLNVDDEAQYAIIECGISDFNEMEPMADLVRPDLTIISSIGPAHIAQFKHLDNTAAEKCKINLYLGDGQAFYNGEAYGVRKQLEAMNLKNRPIAYGFEEKDDCFTQQITTSEDHTAFIYNGHEFRIPIIGRHQVLNSLGAIAIAEHESMNEQEIQAGFDRIVLTEHRLQIRKIHQAIIIDDTYNANPASMTASLETIVEYNPQYHKTVVLGDMLELGEDALNLHASIAEKIDFNAFQRILLVGQQMKALHDALTQKGIASEYYKDISEIAQQVSGELKKQHLIFFKASNGMNFFSIIRQLEEA